MTESHSDAIDELERLHAAATQGEWYEDHGDVMRVEDPDPIARDAFRRDAAFIVASHNRMPALLATLREMLEALEQIRDAGHENGNYCDVEMSNRLEPECDCARGIAVAALDAARARLNGGKAKR